MARAKRFSELSPPRQMLVRMCQGVYFGQILGVLVQNHEPTFEPEPTILVDLKLDADETSRPPLKVTDFPLCEEVCRLINQIDTMDNGRLHRIDVQAGIPRRVVIEAKASDVRPLVTSTI